MIVASNRGPERFVRTEEGFERHRGAGGVVSALRPLLAGGDATWVAAAVGDDDRSADEAGEARSEDFDLHLLALDRRTQQLHYQGVSNAVLWFLHHGLFDLPRRPWLDGRFSEAWEAYREVNRVFADEIAAAADDGEIVLVQDYHLGLVPGMLATRRPDLRLVYFQHTPFCGPSSVRILPTPVASELVSSLACAPAGFHTPRWARAYEAAAAEVLPDTGTPPSFAASLGPDPDALREAAHTEEVEAELASLDEAIGDRKAVVRVDRIEPSKNIVRGFAAYDLLLRRHPEWRHRVVFVALVYPSREGLPEYLAYRQEVEQAAEQLNERWATDTWQPVLLDTEDTYPRSLAGLRRFDVLLVNPIRDGLNLVAKEGPVVNERDGVVALSREAGAHDELGDATVEVHPYDLEQTAEALHTALGADDGERRERARRLSELATARSPRTWLDDLVTHASRPHHP